MVTPLAQKKIPVFDPRPVGEMLFSSLNLEYPGSAYIVMDGRDITIGTYPELDYLPDGTRRYAAGVFTSTARTLAANPAQAVITADATNFLTISTTGAACIQASPDAITWTNGSTWAASTGPTSLILAGSRFVMAGTGGDMSAPYVSNTGQTAANAVVKANWTATTSGTSTTLTQGLAYGSTANAGAGRTVLCVNGALATASGLFYLNDGSTAWTACSGGSTRTRLGITWTGLKYIAICSDSYNQIQTSTDGATFADGTIPFAILNTNGATPSIASDGAGTVVISGYEGSANAAWFIVSKDHGVTWRKIAIPFNQYYLGSTGAIQTQNNMVMSFVNGKFFGANGTAIRSPISADGLAWSYEPMSSRSGVGTVFKGIAYKAGVYCGVLTTTAAQSWTEDMSKYKLPEPTTVYSGYNPGDSFMYYIKTRSN